MLLTENKLRQIIKEEFEEMMKEANQQSGITGTHGAEYGREKEHVPRESTAAVPMRVRTAIKAAIDGFLKTGATDYLKRMAYNEANKEFIMKYVGKNYPNKKQDIQAIITPVQK